MGLISRVSSRTYRSMNETFCEICEATCGETVVYQDELDPYEDTFSASKSQERYETPAISMNRRREEVELRALIVIWWIILTIISYMIFKLSLELYRAKQEFGDVKHITVEEAIAAGRMNGRICENSSRRRRRALVSVLNAW